MLSLPVKRIIWAICLLCIILTMFFKSSLHPIRDPAWLKNSNELSSHSQEPAIILHYHERRPYYITSGSRVQGLVAGVITRAFEFADIPYKWQQTPARRQLDIIRDNEGTDCGVGWFKTPERQQFSKFSTAVYRDTPFVAVARANNTKILKIQTLEQLFQEHRLKLLVKTGYSYGAEIDRKIREFSPWMAETTADNQAMLQMIEGRRADYCFMTREEVKDLLLHAGFNKDSFTILPFAEIPEGNTRYLICSQKVPDEMIERFNQAITHLQGNNRRTK